VGGWLELGELVAFAVKTTGWVGAPPLTVTVPELGVAV
jgi:hypothetical protein